MLACRGAGLLWSLAGRGRMPMCRCTLSRFNEAAPASEERLLARRPRRMNSATGSTRGVASACSTCGEEEACAMISRAALAARSCWTRAHLLLERIASIGGGARPLEGDVASRAFCGLRHIGSK